MKAKPNPARDRVPTVMDATTENFRDKVRKAGGFTMIPRQLSTHAKRLGISATELHVLRTMLEFEWHKGGAFPSRATLAELSCVSIPTVNRVRRSLSCKGLIRVEDRTSAVDGRQLSSQIHFDGLWKALDMCQRLAKEEEASKKRAPGFFRHTRPVGGMRMSPKEQAAFKRTPTVYVQESTAVEIASDSGNNGEGTGYHTDRAGLDPTTSPGLSTLTPNYYHLSKTHRRKTKKEPKAAALRTATSGSTDPTGDLRGVGLHSDKGTSVFFEEKKVPSEPNPGCAGPLPFDANGIPALPYVDAAAAATAREAARWTERLAGLYRVPAPLESYMADSKPKPPVSTFAARAALALAQQETHKVTAEADALAKDAKKARGAKPQFDLDSGTFVEAPSRPASASKSRKADFSAGYALRSVWKAEWEKAFPGVPLGWSGKETGQAQNLVNAYSGNVAAVEAGMRYMIRNWTSIGPKFMKGSVMHPAMNLFVRCHGTFIPDAAVWESVRKDAEDVAAWKAAHPNTYNYPQDIKSKFLRVAQVKKKMGMK